MKRVGQKLSSEVQAKLFLALLQSEKLPCGITEREFRFAPPRRWRFDWAFTSLKIALEVEGAVWTRGRHTRGSGFLKDMEKYNEAAVRGWLVLRCTPDTLLSPETIETLKRAMKLRSAA